MVRGRLKYQFRIKKKTLVYTNYTPFLLNMWLTLRNTWSFHSSNLEVLLLYLKRRHLISKRCLIYNNRSVLIEFFYFWEVRSQDHTTHLSNIFTLQNGGFKLRLPTRCKPLFMFSPSYFYEGPPFFLLFTGWLQMIIVRKDFPSFV